MDEFPDDFNRVEFDAKIKQATNKNLSQYRSKIYSAFNEMNSDGSISLQISKDFTSKEHEMLQTELLSRNLNLSDIWRDWRESRFITIT